MRSEARMLSPTSRKLGSLYVTLFVLVWVFTSPLFVGVGVASTGNVTISGNAYQFVGTDVASGNTPSLGSWTVEPVGGANAGNTAAEAALDVNVFWTDTGTKRTLNINLVQTSVTGNGPYGSWDVEKYDLSHIGYDRTTRFKISGNTQAYSPTILIGAGNMDDSRGWSTVQNDDGSVTTTIHVSPISSDGYFTDDGSGPSSFPGTLVSNAHEDASVGLATVDTSDTDPDLNGMALLTDAQSFADPIYTPPASGGPSIAYDVEAPHYAPDGTTVNQGFFEGFLPASLLTAWGDPQTDSLTTQYSGNSPTTAGYTEVRRGGSRTGVLVGLDYHYSSGTVTTGTGSVDTTAPTATVTASATTVTEGDTVRFDASGSADDVGISQYGWDFDGDGTQDDFGGSATNSYTYTTAGTYTVALTVGDSSNNVDTATLTITVESTSSGGGSGGGSSDGRTRDDDENSTPSPLETPTPVSTPVPTETPVDTAVPTAVPPTTPAGQTSVSQTSFTPPAMASETASGTRVTTDGGTAGASGPGFGPVGTVAALALAALLAKRRRW